MILDLGSFAFGSTIKKGGGTPSWGTSIGQGKDYKITYPGAEQILMGMLYNSIPLDSTSIPLGKGGHVYKASETESCLLAAQFQHVFVNGLEVGYPFTMILVREHSDSHSGRKSIKYSDKIECQLPSGKYSNKTFIDEARKILNLEKDACWFVYKMEVVEQDALVLYAGIVNDKESEVFQDSEERKKKWLEFIPAEEKDSLFRNMLVSDSDDSLQRIFYGAPGTGKSHTIKNTVDEKKKINYRVTFHPDSDYSTFVGCYKPAMKSAENEYSMEELVAKLKEVKLSGVSYPCHKFSAQHWKSLKKLSAQQIVQILKACGFTESMNVEVSKGVAVGEDMANSTKEEQIVYRFVPQAFTKAYTAAWNTTEDVYLIIEEINRGNCAQIFGDLFQLLDRNKEGFSEYPVDADSDLADHIRKALADSTRNDFRDGVKEGTKLVLPNNLYIWATMNTSDQSLFPIDSAFKRRWDWEYIPITNANEGWLIEADGKRYDWWEFLEKMNDKIGSTNNSEDKKLGYFFCKSKDGIIDASTFVGKVVFYVWNDVFKDFAEETEDLFRDTDGSLLSFNKFYTVEGGMTKVVESKVALLLQNLGVEPIGDAEEDEEVVDDEENDVAAKEGKKQRKESLISIQIPNQPIIRSAESTQYKAFVKALRLIGIDKIIPLLDSIKYKRLECPVLSTEKYPVIENKTKGYSYSQEGELFIVKGCKSYTYIRILEDLNDLLKIGLTLETK